MTSSLKGRVALITGASKGIGRAVAEEMAQAGARVVVCSRKQEAVDEVAQSIKDAGGEAVGVAAHVGKQEDRARLVASTLDVYGRLDVLVNNAAVNPVFGPLLVVEEGAFDKIMEVNLKAPFELGKLCQPHLAKHQRGSIINISSIGGISPEPLLGIYSVSKAGLISLTKSMAREWGPDVRANAVCPGLVKTKFAEALWANEDILEEAVGHQPIKRAAEPHEVSGLCAFLASDAASYCTGAVYMVDGGNTL